MTDKELEERILRGFAINTNTLDLGALGLTTLPSWVGGYIQGICLERATSLEYLHLSWGQLAEVPKWVFEFKQLKILSLEHNQLATLPEAIGDLRSLRGLWLGDNPWVSLPRSLNNLTNATLWGLNPEEFDRLIEAHP